MIDDIRPKQKPTVDVTRQADLIFIGMGDYVVEVADPSGWVEHLFRLMDGRRTIPQLYEMTAIKYPELSYDDFIDGLTQFDEAGFLENEAFTPDGLLDEYDLARWERNIDFLGAFANMRVSKYEMQYRIKTARVAILGLGGLGSHLLYDFAAMGVQDIRAVDFDRLEISNLNRQILYDEADVGQLKTDLALKRIRAFAPRARVEVVPLRLSSTEDVLSVIHDREYVVCVADRPALELVHWVNEACVRQNAVLLLGGLDLRRSIYWSMIPGTTGCVECWRRQVAQSNPVAVRLRDRPKTLISATFVAPVALLAGLISSDFTRMVTGFAPPVSAGRLLEIPFDTMDIHEVERWERLDDCPVCQAAQTERAVFAGV
jgi:molybdopterin/thiamine biosynthesis adenylyltransferase